eukprot:CAMPEP_0181475568 /NCGR_PEP_ID=MMETSP1110-20121109/41252_1 /TAXON_ID=174948 /ORGANISM="Symbiodinium sp., Strain CCMP421" /LENGTH=53 /DNA_ID=CAMNT_0023600811 /DNA_START=773 /DNA_END=931 /DNA_ORIENTATION=+
MFACAQGVWRTHGTEVRVSHIPGIHVSCKSDRKKQQKPCPSSHGSLKRHERLG